MAVDKIIDSVKLTFRENSPQEVRLINYLRGQRSKGKELKTEMMKAVASFFDVYAIAEDPNSTQSEIEQAFVKSLNMLSGQMSDLEVYCRGRIPLSSDSWKRFGLLPSSFPSSASTGLIAPLPSSALPAAIAQAIELVPAASPPEEIAWGDIDPYELSDEEREAHYAKMPRLNPITLPND